MKIKQLNVEKLYGCYNYNVNFNEDITFIYGRNGCGKTTVLNIIGDIITGQLFKLFAYEFEMIELQYAKSSNPNEVKIIKIWYASDSLNIIFNEQKYRILRNGRVPGYLRERELDREFVEVRRYYFEKYHFLEEIKDIFNYVYLPLNRTFSYNDDSCYPIKIHRNMLIDGEASSGYLTRDNSMQQIEKLIASRYTEINTEIVKYNDEFRNEILKSLSAVKTDYSNIAEIIGELENFTGSKLEIIKRAYIMTLKELKLIGREEEERYSAFFNSFEQAVEKIYTAEKENLQAETLMKTIFQFQEILKIKNIIRIAKKIEQKKTNARKPIEDFITTMNSFIKNSEDEKTIGISSSGKVYFTTKYTKHPISIEYLSSGEKQLITFFANLIFNVKKGSSGIFVVDEPEISLHLSWQKIFVEKTIELNKNIQLIFATHAPEIIGKYREKMYKLEKQYIEG